METWRGDNKFTFNLVRDWIWLALLLQKVRSSFRVGTLVNLSRFQGNLEFSRNETKNFRVAYI